MKKAISLIVLFFFISTNNYGLAQAQTPKKVTDTPFTREVREGYVPVFMKHQLVDGLFHYDVASVPKEVISADNKLLFNIETKPTVELLNSNISKNPEIFPAGLKVYTDAVPIKVNADVVKQAKKLTGLSVPLKIGTEVSITTKASYCSPGFAAYDDKMMFDPAKVGIPSICRQLDELKLIGEMNPACYSYLEDRWASGKGVEIYKSILPYGVTAPTQSLVGATKQDLIQRGKKLQDMDYNNSPQTIKDLYNKVYRQAIKMALASMMSMYEYYDSRSGTVPACKGDRLTCLKNFLTALNTAYYGKQIDPELLKEAAHFYYQSVLPPTNISFTKDLEQDMAEFNQIVDYFNYLTALGAKVAKYFPKYNQYDKSEANAEKFYKNFTEAEVDFIKRAGLYVSNNRNRSPYDYDQDKIIKDELRKAFFETRFGKLFMTEAFSEYVGDVNGNKELKKIEGTRGLQVLKTSIGQLKTLVMASIKELVDDKKNTDEFQKPSKYGNENSLTKGSKYNQLVTTLRDYLKKYPFAFRQDVNRDFFLDNPSAREFLVTVSLISTQITYDQLSATKDYVVNGGAAIVGLALMCTGACAPLGLTITGYAVSALVVVNAASNVCSLRTDLSVFKEGAASGSRDLQKTYDDVEEAKKQIKSEIWNAGLEVGGIAIGLGAGAIFSLKAAKQGAKLSTLMEEANTIIKSKNLKSEEEVLSFLSKGDDGLSQINNVDKLSDAEKTYLRAKFATVEDQNQKDLLIASINRSKNPNKTVEKIAGGGTATNPKKTVAAVSENNTSVSASTKNTVNTKEEDFVSVNKTKSNKIEDEIPEVSSSNINTNVVTAVKKVGTVKLTEVTPSTIRAKSKSVIIEMNDGGTAEFKTSQELYEAYYKEKPFIDSNGKTQSLVRRKKVNSVEELKQESKLAEFNENAAEEPYKSVAIGKPGKIVTQEDVPCHIYKVFVEDIGKEIPIIIPDFVEDMDAVFQSMKHLIEESPVKYVKQVKKIRYWIMNDSEKLIDTLLTQGNYGGRFSTQMGMSNVSKSVYYHEFAHGMGKLLSPTIKGYTPIGWAKIVQKEGKGLYSAYARSYNKYKSALAEDFADCFADYLISYDMGQDALKAFKSKYPLRAQYFEDALRFKTSGTLDKVDVAKLAKAGNLMFGLTGFGPVIVLYGAKEAFYFYSEKDSEDRTVEDPDTIDVIPLEDVKLKTIDTKKLK